ncbi:MAG: SDR family NAD(P)-dependent oxidoreductase, partial [Alphaproteobacteria bacterium]|nr:SDR family NAD(P)-dependent oxidoreductase [Alphaproteobacteria bacterium]
MEIRFDGRVAVVTGAGGGLGRGHALLLASRGAKVVVNDPGGAVDGSGGGSAAADKVVAEIKAAGGTAIANYASVADAKAAEGMIAAALSAWGRVDVLINNAGILRDKTFAKMSLEEFEAVTRVHFLGSVYATKAAWP